MPAIAHGARGGYYLIPDRIASNQKFYNESRRPFTVKKCDSAGNPIGGVRTVVLRGDLYGIDTAGTGDMVVSTWAYTKNK